MSRNVWALSDLCTPWCVHVVATLRIADHIAAGTDRIEDLAAAAQCDPAILRGVLDHLVGQGAFEQPKPGRPSGPRREEYSTRAQIGRLIPGARGPAPAYHEVFRRSQRITACSTNACASNLLDWACPTRYIGIFESTKTIPGGPSRFPRAWCGHLRGPETSTVRLHGSPGASQARLFARLLAAQRPRRAQRIQGRAVEIGGGEASAGGDVGEANQRMHHRQTGAGDRV